MSHVLLSVVLTALVAINPPRLVGGEKNQGLSTNYITPPQEVVADVWKLICPPDRSKLPFPKSVRGPPPKIFRLGGGELGSLEQSQSGKSNKIVYTKVNVS